MLDQFQGTIGAARELDRERDHRGGEHGDVARCHRAGGRVLGEQDERRAEGHRGDGQRGQHTSRCRATDQGARALRHVLADPAVLGPEPVGEAVGADLGGHVAPGQDVTQVVLAPTARRRLAPHRDQQSGHQPADDHHGHDGDHDEERERRLGADQHREDTDEARGPAGHLDAVLRDLTERDASRGRRARGRGDRAGSSKRRNGVRDTAVMRRCSASRVTRTARTSRTGIVIVWIASSGLSRARSRTRRR